MALDRDQVGLLFQVNADTMDARQQMELFQGVVEGMALEVRDQFQRVNASLADTTRETGKLAQTLGDATTNQLRGFLGQFGMIGDVASDMIPALSGTTAAIVGMTGATVAAGAALAGAAMQAMDYTGQIDDLAQVTNLTTETIQSLRLAATLSGQSFEDASQSAIIFQKRIEEAKGGNEELMATFKALGVDLNGPVDAAFRQTLERMGQVADGSAKTAATLDLFGKSGAKLLPVMDQVGGSFDALTARARELGLVLDEDAIAKSNELADRIDVLKLRMSALVTDVGIAAIRTFDNWSTAVGRVSVTLRELFTNASTIIPNLKKLLAAGLLATIPGGAPVDLAKLFGGEAGQTGFQGPGIDQVTGLPELLLPGKTKPAAGGGRAAAEKLVGLPSGDAVARAYEAYRRAILNEEQLVERERERLRIAAIDGEEERLRDRLIQQDQAIEEARAAAAAGSTTARAAVLAQTVANLEAERTLILGKLDELQVARDARLEADAAKELQLYRQTQEQKLDEYSAMLDREEELRQAAAARRQAALEADPSSPLNIFGEAGQTAADAGAGIFGQLGASASEALGQVSAQMGSFKDMMTDVFGGIAGGLQSMIQGFIMTGRLGGQAFKAMAAQIVSALTAQAAVKAIFELAEGFAASARFDYASATQHFTAAKFYGAVAGVAAAASVGLAAIGPGGGGAGGQFLAQDRGMGGGSAAVREQGGARRSNEPQVIIIRAETEPGVMVSKVVQDYRSNGEMRQALRRDLLGEF